MNIVRSNDGAWLESPYLIPQHGGKILPFRSLLTEGILHELEVICEPLE